MAQLSRPWTGTVTGDAGPYSADDWATSWHLLGGGAHNTYVIGQDRGIVRFDQAGDNALRVSEDSPPSTAVLINPGKAFVDGTYYENTGGVSQTIAANASGNPRIDRIILRKDWTLQTVRLAYLQGTPAASPTPPALTKTAGATWEITVAQIAVANGFSTITNTNITDERRWWDDNTLQGLTGEIRPWASNVISPPDSWLLCSGQAISRFTYNRLFQTIGTVFGVGDGSTTFNIPDLRGRVIIARDNQGGTSANRITDAQADVFGGTGGTETHQLTTAELPAHTHPDVVAENAGSPFTAGSSSPGTSATVGLGDNTVGGSVSGSTGSDTAHPNTQPWIAISYIIKT